jgi:hypothetical protein
MTRRKRPRDFSQAAKLVVDIATGAVEDRPPTPEEQGKDPAAVKRGRLGGIKGGKVRAATLTKTRRKNMSRVQTDPLSA